MNIEEVSESELQEAFTKLCPDPKRAVLKDIYPELKKLGIFCSIINLLPDLGYKEHNQNLIFSKLIRIDKKIELAFENEFFLEWISLMLIKAEFWMRVFLYNTNSYSDKDVLKDSLTFETLIYECKKANIDKIIGKNLQKTNKSRIQYIHNYLKDGFEYDSIKTNKAEFEKTLDDLENIVKKSSIRILDDAGDLDNTIGFVRFVRFR